MGLTGPAVIPCHPNVPNADSTSGKMTKCSCEFLTARESGLQETASLSTDRTVDETEIPSLLDYFQHHLEQL